MSGSKKKGGNVQRSIEPLPDLLRNHVLPHTEEIWNRIQFVGRMNAVTSLANPVSRDGSEEVTSDDMSSDSSSVDGYIINNNDFDGKINVEL